MTSVIRDRVRHYIERAALLSEEETVRAMKLKLELMGYEVTEVAEPAPSPHGMISNVMKDPDEIDDETLGNKSGL